MVGFAKPRFEYDYDLAAEKTRFDAFFSDPARAIPKKGPNEIDLASWNIANLGVQKRRDKDLLLIAHVLSKFDIIAVQEVNANLEHFTKVMQELAPCGYDMVMTDPAGNQERLAVVYRKGVVQPRQLLGELDYNPSGRVIKGKYVIAPKTQKFTMNGKRVQTVFYGFNRNPFLSTWQVVGRSTTFLLANVHIYYGKEKETSPEFGNRVAEVYFLAEWARRQQGARKKNAYETNVILLGDMNIPKMESRNPVYRALLRRGLQPSRYSTEAGTTIQEFTTYDQVVFTNKKLKVKEIKGQTAVVVDYDNFVFRDLWAEIEAGTRSMAQFKAWARFAVSDHRPMFVRLKV